MKLALTLRRSSDRCTTATIAALSLLATTQQVMAQESDMLVLQEVVVSASRAPQEWRQTSSSVSVISLEEMQVTQVPDLKSSLGQESGVSVVATGATGGDTSIYIRGAYPHHTLLVVDGVRMNDRAAGYGAFLGGAGMKGIDRIEVLRGAQSTLYGSAAMGGIVLMNTAKGTPDLEGGVEISGGSFDTQSAAGALSGSVGGFGFSVSASRYETANERDFNDYDNTGYSARLSYDITDSLEVGATYRKQDATFETPGSLYYYSPGTADTGNELVTGYVEWRATDTVTTKFVYGHHEREYDWIDDWGVNSQLNKRDIYEWQMAWAPSRGLSIVFGANYEESEYQIDDNLSGDEILAGFLSGTFDVTDTLTVTAGIRYDDFETVGSATTWRTGLAWMATPTTKVRATYGTGFAAPGSSDRYGVPAWSQLPNPDLQPEESKGWDIGVDQSFLGGALAVSVTYFVNEFEDLIDWVYTDLATYTGMYQNRSSAKTSGVEFGVTASPTDAVSVRFGYSYLDGEDGTTGARLTRRPRHSIDASSWVNVTDNITLGLGVRGVYDRIDSGGPMEDYTTARAFASYQLGNFSIKARVENLFDEEYQEVYGYPALTRGYYGSVEWNF